MYTKPMVLAALGGAMIGCGVGLILGYKYGQKVTIEKFDQQLQDEIAATKKYYMKMAKKEEYEDPVNIAVGIVYAEGYEPKEEEEVEEDNEPSNEEKGTEPYVITLEAFVANPNEHDQQSITYFEGDDVLIDERNVPIEDIDSYIGLAALDRFGYGSKNPDVVYVRNERISMDLEVTRQSGSYERMFVGEIRHSDRRIRKFKIADE